jgi:pimeloyl-ACP methyl ester carboxylesterase
VFVHGWSCDRTYWKHQVPYFADRSQVVAVDLAGHGRSGAGRAEWTMPAFGEDVVAIADQLGLEHLVLIGHSMGGDVIVEAARRLRDRVVGLVWVDVYQTLDPGESWDAQAFIAPFRADFVGWTREFVRGMFLPTSDERLVEWVVADMSSAPPEIALDALAHAVTFDPFIVAALPELRAPLVSINAGYEPTDVESLERHGFRTIVMPDVGHFLMMEEPEAFNRLLEETVAEFTSAGSTSPPS